MNLPLYPVKYLFIHETQFSRFTNPDQFNQTNNYHKSEGFYVSSLGKFVGYNYEIASTGTVHMARIEGEETCAVLGFNKSSVSIALDGYFYASERPSKDQETSLIPLMISVMIRHNIPITNVLPHRMSYDLLGQLRKKTCYGSILSDTWAQGLIENWEGTVPALGADRPDLFEC